MSDAKKFTTSAENSEKKSTMSDEKKATTSVEKKTSLVIGHNIRGGIGEKAKVLFNENITAPLTNTTDTKIGSTIGKDVERTLTFGGTLNVTDATGTSNSTGNSVGLKSVEKTGKVTFKPSHMVIFNQQSFVNSEELPDRDGSEKDVKALKDTFARFGVKPIVRTDSDLEEIVHEIKKLSVKDFSNHKLFMLVIMTHGAKNGYAYARDEKFRIRTTLIDPIIGNLKLNGIPKIFIIVACRGDAHFMDSDAILSGQTGYDYYNHLICYSTFEGHLSMRDQQQGTMYIQKLCESKNLNPKALRQSLKDYMKN